MEYKPRLLDKEIEQRFKSKGAILIEGPKWCGKSTTARHHANSELDLARKDTRLNIRQLLEINVPQALQGQPPLLIDEWQEIPEIWDAVRHEVDVRGMPNQIHPYRIGCAI